MLNVYINGVRSVLKNIGAIGIVAALGVGAHAVADVSVRHYNDIPDRNVFGLKPPPSQPPATNPPAQLPKITLTGITTILGNKRALMMVAPVAVKPGEKVNELSMILTEGQREGEIEVLQIDEKRGSVKVNNAGTVMLLTFEKDGARLPATPAPVPGRPGVPLPLPSVTNSRPNPLTPPAHVAYPAFPTRVPRTPPAAGQASSAVGGVPTPTGMTVTPPPASTAPNQDITPEEQAIVMELQRQAAGNSTLPPLPPTQLTPVPTQPVQPTTPGATLTLPVPGQPQPLVPQ
jgi:hypothetical protein